MDTKVIEHKTGMNEMLESVAFGVTDGCICFLGIIVGVARATSDIRAVIIAAVAGGIADALGNSVGFFVSQTTERTVQLNETNGEDHGLVHTEKEVYLSGVATFLATVAVLGLLLFPFAFFTIWPAVAIATLTSIVIAFLLGCYVGRLTGRPFKTGIKYASVTAFGAAVSYGVGELLNIWLN
jgi:predicted membrane protein (TIGR00267 family)